MDQYPLNSYDNEQRWAAMTRSAVTPAVVTMVLYLVLWLPGLLANVVFWREASHTERLLGRSPEGTGCLLALFAIDHTARTSSG